MADSHKALRVLLLCCDGSYQLELARRVAARFDLVGIVLHKPHQPKGSLASRFRRYLYPSALWRYLQVLMLLPRFERAAEPLRQKLFPHDGADWPLPTLEVQDINQAEVAELISDMKPDIVLVNGTNLLRKPILSLLPRIRHGVVNLHTGLSPYSRGGNCNLFMILEGHPELVGITVHHISGGIDSGDIIISAQVPMQAGDNYEMLDIRSFDSGFDALLGAAAQLAEGRAVRVAQWETGKLFLKRTGYVYEPFHRLRANRLLASGLVRRYLAQRATADSQVITVGSLP